ncbi:Rha family transcriptional regulator [Paenibacillus sp. UMB4589-SE434]|uniref:Rha family transcriptional regulator n=1 Tax=Paenibacillus sp. UMB4589-SE434 TaxID=3046314 RepID=UPI002550FB64|nr:Rha family transcriptional regulator [Paenibacillus sp. UMB4589-SE434]MDK8182070.1 Rha family transcriptional regulator [Paenibacillus sp. UMB4589-SE434]
MNQQLVFIQNGRAVTDSLMIASEFEKEHDDVLRDIRSQIDKLNEAEEMEFSLRNFEESTYRNERGRTYPKFELTEEAFVLVAMSYTTAKAMKMKVKFISEFKRMSQQAQISVPTISPNQAMAIALQQTAEMMIKVPVLETRLDQVEQKVDTQITLDSGEQRRLQKAIASKVCSIEPTKSERGQLFRQLHNEIKDRWVVTSYKDVLRTKLSEVLRYVDAWVPKRS